MDGRTWAGVKRVVEPLTPFGFVPTRPARQIVSRVPIRPTRAALREVGAEVVMAGSSAVGGVGARRCRLSRTRTISSPYPALR
jgi:hypothetical protein